MAKSSSPKINPIFCYKRQTNYETQFSKTTYCHRWHRRSPLRKPAHDSTFPSTEAILERGANIKNLNFPITKCLSLLCTIILSATFTGCASSPAKTDTPAQQAPPAANLPTIRIKAGLDDAFKDTKGTTWSADTGFDGGEAVDRPELDITGTDRPELYHSERYSMDSYTIKVPNGSYLVKLHFSEDYDGITDPTMRLFTYAVKDGDPTKGKTIKEVKDFSPWKAAGAQFKAYVDTTPVDVTSGQISITFIPQVENPQINAIEIVPR
jgi:Malectin domain